MNEEGMEKGIEELQSELVPDIGIDEAQEG